MAVAGTAAEGCPSSHSDGHGQAQHSTVEREQQQQQKQQLAQPELSSPEPKSEAAAESRLLFTPEATPEELPEAAEPVASKIDFTSPESPQEDKDGSPETRITNNQSAQRSSLQTLRELQIVSGRLSSGEAGADNVPAETMSSPLHAQLGSADAQCAPEALPSLQSTPLQRAPPTEMAPAPTPTAPTPLFERPAQADDEAKEAEASNGSTSPPASAPAMCDEGHEEALTTETSTHQGFADESVPDAVKQAPEACEGLGQSLTAQAPTPQEALPGDGRPDAVEQEPQHSTEAPKPLPVVGELVDGVVAGIGARGVFVDIGLNKVATLSTTAKDTLRPGQQLLGMRVEKVAPKLGLVKLVWEEGQAGIDAADTSQQQAPEVAGGQPDEGVFSCSSRSSTPSLRNRLVRAGFLAEGSVAAPFGLPKPAEEPQEPERSPERRHEEPEVELCTSWAAPCSFGKANHTPDNGVASEVAAAATPARALLGIQSPLRKSDSRHGSPGSQAAAQQMRHATPPPGKVIAVAPPQALSVLQHDSVHD